MRNDLVLATAAPASLAVAGDDRPSFDRHGLQPVVVAEETRETHLNIRCEANFVFGLKGYAPMFPFSGPPDYASCASTAQRQASTHAAQRLSLCLPPRSLLQGGCCNAKGEDKKEPAPAEEEVAETARIPTAAAAVPPASLLHRGCCTSAVASLQRRGIHARSSPRCRAGTPKTKQAQGHGGCCRERKAQRCLCSSRFMLDMRR